MKNRNYVYEYEITRKRKFLKKVEQIVNYGIIITLSVIIFSSVIFAIINLI